MIRGPLLQHLEKYYDNSLENIGNPDSFVWYGPRWAQAATAPSRLYKAYPTEGGVRVPCVIRYPGFKNGQIVDIFATVMDIAPTVLEMAGLSHPAPEWKGRQVVPMRGESFRAWAENEVETIHEKDFVQGWELLGRGAIRKGNWKAVFIPKVSMPSATVSDYALTSTKQPKGPEKWQLYDLSKDPGEIHDLAGEEPEKVQELLTLWDQYVLENGVIPMQPELGEYIEALDEQMTEKGWMEYEWWKPGAIENPEAHIIQPPRFKSLRPPAKDLLPVIDSF